MNTPLEQRLRTDLGAVGATTHISDAPRAASVVSLAAARRRRRRATIAVAVGAAAVAIPTAAAAAGGIDPFGWTHQTGVPYAVDNASRHELLTLPGAPGHTLHLQAAAVNNNSGKCWSVVDPALSAAQQVLASTCISPAGMPTSLSDGGGASGPTGGVEFIIAPGAKRLTVTTPSGTRSAPVVEGVGALYLTASEVDESLTVTSFGPAGGQLGAMAIYVSSGKKPLAPPLTDRPAAVPVP